MSLRSISKVPWHLKLVFLIWVCNKSAIVLYMKHFLLMLLATWLVLTRLFYCTYMELGVCGCCCQLWAPLTSWQPLLLVGTVENLGQPFCHPMTKIFFRSYMACTDFECTGTVDLFPIDVNSSNECELGIFLIWITNFHSLKFYLACRYMFFFSYIILWTGRCLCRLLN